MMRTPYMRLRLLAGVLVVLGVCAGGVVLAQGNGSLEGLVRNGTAGGPELGAGLPVTLRVFRGESEVDSFQTETQAGGAFLFEGLDTDPSLVYVPELVYLGVVYQSAEPYRFDGGATALDSTLTVFETTEDDSGISLDSVHIIAESFEQVLRISEIHLFGNRSDRTYIGSSDQAAASDRTTVNIPLPEEAVGIAFQGEGAGDRFLEVGGGMLDTEPVPPGSESSLAFFSYHLVVSGGTVPLERRFSYPVSNLSILVAQPGLELRSEQLSAMGPQDFEGKQYQLYVAAELGAEAPLNIELVPVAGAQGGAGMPMPPDSAASGSAGSPRGNQGTLLWLGAGLAILAVVGVVVYAASAGRSPSRGLRPPDLLRKPESRRLLAELADLEDDFASGSIDEAGYESQRAELFDAVRAQHGG